MSKAFTVKMAVRAPGSLHVECLNMAGDILGEANLSSEATLEDVVDTLKPKLELPLPFARVDLYVSASIVIDRKQLARSHEQFIISADCFNYCRKYLAAMAKKAFFPGSKHFDEGWTPWAAADVDLAEVEPILESLGASTQAETVRVMQVLGHLTSCAETWKLLNLNVSVPVHYTTSRTMIFVGSCYTFQF